MIRRHNCLTIVLLILVSLPQAAWPIQISVKDAPYNATADGVTDDTSAIQSALDFVGTAGGGIVFIPTGRYLVAGQLNIPDDVTIEGVASAPASLTLGLSQLLSTANADNEAGAAFITLNTNSTVSSLCIWYPDQDDTGDIIPYPWTITSASNTSNASIVNVTLVNPYKGVNFSSAGSSRYLIDGLYGQPLRYGIYIDNNTDVCRINNVHFWPFWSIQPPVREFTNTQGQAFIFGRSDWQMMSNSFCFGYGIGFRFSNFGSGPTHGTFTNIAVDESRMAVFVEQSSSKGIEINNGQFASFLNPSPQNLVVQPQHSGVIQINSSAFWGNSVRAISIEGLGHVGISNCNFSEWGGAGANLPAINVIGGTASVTGSHFTKSPALKWHTPVAALSVSDNTFDTSNGQPAVIGDNPQLGDISVVDNVTRAGSFPGHNAWISETLEVDPEWLTQMNNVSATDLLANRLERARILVNNSANLSLTDWQIANSISGDAALINSDSDDNVDLLEWAFGSDPLIADSIKQPSMTINDAEGMDYTFIRRIGLESSYILEESLDLASWENAEIENTTTDVISTGFESITFTVSYDKLTKPNQFLRLQILPEPPTL